MRKIVLAAGLVAAVIACRRSPPAPEIAMAPAHADEGAPASPAAGSPAEAGGLVRVAGITFSAPSSWRRETPSSSMRAAQFSIPGSANEKDGTVAVYYFGSGQGGGVEENVQRWESQFTDDVGRPAHGDSSEVVKNGLKVTIVTVRGTYASGMPMGPSTPEPGSSLWGAIIVAPEGSVFVKATGPAALIDRSKGDFDSLLDSLRASASV
jgi:hypothetical protein